MKKSRFNKIFTGFLVSHISILVIPIIIIGSFGMSQFINILEEDVKSNTFKTLSHAKQTFDVRLKEVDDISCQLGESKNVIQQLYQRNKDKVDENFNTLEIFRDMNLLTVPNKFIYALYIYFDKDNILVSSNSKYDYPFFYDEMLNYEKYSAEEWGKMIKDYTGRKYLPSMALRSYKPIRVMTCLRALPVNGKTNMGSVIALIDEENVKQLFMTEKYSDKSSFFIIDTDNNILFTTDKQFDIAQFPMNRISDSEGFFEYEFSNEDSICVYLSSDINNWKYISVIPKDFVMGKVNNIRNMIIFLIIACTIIGVLLAYFLSSRNYKPINNIFEILSEQSQSNNESIKHDYAIISRSIRDTFKENKKLEDRIKQYTPNIKLSFISKLVMGRFKDLAEVEDMLESLGIKFKSLFFGVIAFYIDDCSEFTVGSNEKQYNLVKFIIANVVEEIAGRENAAYTLELDDKIIFLINYNAGKTKEDYEKEALNIVREATDFFNDKFRIVLSVGIGNAYQGFERIYDSYMEANTALNYRIVNGKNSLTLYKNISTDSNNYYYPIDVEMQLINQVKAGDYDGAGSCLDLIFIENFSKRKLPLKLIQCVSFDIISTILKLLYEININYSEVFGEDLDITSELLNCNTLEEMRVGIKEVVYKVCKYLNEHRISKNSELITKIIQYINKNYADKNLSLVSIANAFDLSGSYTSKFFKDHTGYNFADYLNRVRIKQAKELLLREDLIINDIAEMVGYNSGNTFIRTYKKYEAITPGQLKKRKS